MSFKRATGPGARDAWFIYPQFHSEALTLYKSWLKKHLLPTSIKSSTVTSSLLSFLTALSQNFTPTSFK